MIIGIDPDVELSGVAVTKAGRIISLDKMALFELVAFIDEHKHRAVFHLEDIQHVKPTFPRFMKDNRGCVRPVTPAVRDNISQKVGMVKAAARFIQNGLKNAGAEYVLIKPLKGDIKKAKSDAQYFNRLTGWKGRSNEDNRDAALLALYGNASKKVQLGKA